MIDIYFTVLLCHLTVGLMDDKLRRMKMENGTQIIKTRTAEN